MNKGEDWCLGMFKRSSTGRTSKNLAKIFDEANVDGRACQ
jgi:hypothetical protein